jgi:hypothetical protein
MEKNSHGFTRMEMYAWLFTLTYVAAIVWLSNQLLMP